MVTDPLTQSSYCTALPSLFPSEVVSTVNLFVELGGGVTPVTPERTARTSLPRAQSRLVPAHQNIAVALPIQT